MQYFHMTRLVTVVKMLLPYQSFKCIDVEKKALPKCQVSTGLNLNSKVDLLFSVNYFIIDHVLLSQSRTFHLIWGSVIYW